MEGYLLSILRFGYTHLPFTRLVSEGGFLRILEATEPHSHRPVAITPGSPSGERGLGIAHAAVCLPRRVSGPGPRCFCSVTNETTQIQAPVGLHRRQAPPVRGSGTTEAGPSVISSPTSVPGGRFSSCSTGKEREEHKASCCSGLHDWLRMWGNQASSLCTLSDAPMTGKGKRNINDVIARPL